MVFTEMMEAVDRESTICDMVMERTMAFVEASLAEYESHVQEAELKVIKESGTEEDLQMLLEAAEEGFIVKAKKSIDKIIQTLIEYIKKAKGAITDFFTKKENDEKLNKIQQLINKNHKVKNKKVKVPDMSKINRTIDKYEATVRKKLAAVKAGKASEKDKEDLAKAEATFVKEHKAACAAVITVTVGAALGIIFALKKDATGVSADAVDNVNLNVESSVEDAAVAVGITNALSHSIKVRMDSIKWGIQSTFKSVKGAITGEKELDYSNNAFARWHNEAADDIVLDYEEVEEAMSFEELDAMLETILEDANSEVEGEEITESEGFSSKEEAEAYLEAIEDTLFESGDETSEEEVEEVTAEEYLEALEAELFGDDEEPVEEDTDDDNTITAEEYLEALEEEIFGKNDDTVVEEDAVIEAEVDALMAELENM